MSSDDLIDFVLDLLADGKSVDWAELAKRAASDEERERLECLRIVSAIAKVHGSSDDIDAGDAPSTQRLDPPPAASTPREQEGETWGRYQLLQEVGSGSFGRVYRAWDPGLECEIAIKILHQQVADPALKERLLREGRALAKVRDPHIVSVYGVESHGERVGLCMEFIHGETLEDVLKPDKTLNAREAMLVGQDVCRALTTVHRADFVHRDVKARNIMRDRNGRIVLMDFGTGLEIERLEAASGPWNIAGTPLYMAPEVLVGQPASQRSDVYSVGVLLYHLVTRRYPVEGNTLKELRAAHMFGKRTRISDRRSDLPTAFIKVVDSALAANPQERCPTAGGLLEALAIAVSDELVQRDARARALFRSSVILASAVAGLIGFGALSSGFFNLGLGRSEFVNESVLEWLVWGLKSVLGPSVLLMFALIGLSLALVCRRVLLSASRQARDVERLIVAQVRRWKLDDVGNLSACALVLTIAVFLAVTLSFSRLLGALMADTLTAPASELALLSPQSMVEHRSYREAFIWTAILCVMAWYPPLRLARKKREPLNRGFVAGGAAVFLLAILMLDIPYRVLWHNDVFDAVQWRGARCYVTGERRDDMLLFCPLLNPRNRIVNAGAKEVTPLGLKESIFVQFSAAQ